jgi:predicted MFS family arabinose efflux permease
MALVLYMKGSFQTGYALLLAPTLLALASLGAARVIFPLPHRLAQKKRAGTKGFTRAYWLFMLAGAFFAAGLTSFELISFHLSQTGVVTGEWIPAFLAIATIGGVFASLAFGKLYDKIGLPVVLGAVVLSSLFSPLVFEGGFLAVLAGLMFWGIGYATQDTLLKAVIAGVLPEGKRNMAFGLFYTGYGSGWLIGSIVTGLLYGKSLTALIAFCILVQLASLPLFLLAERSKRPNN